MLPLIMSLLLTGIFMLKSLLRWTNNSDSSKVNIFFSSSVLSESVFRCILSWGILNVEYFSMTKYSVCVCVCMCSAYLLMEWLWKNSIWLRHPTELARDRFLGAGVFLEITLVSWDRSTCAEMHIIFVYVYRMKLNILYCV